MPQPIVPDRKGPPAFAEDLVAEATVKKVATDTVVDVEVDAGELHVGKLTITITEDYQMHILYEHLSDVHHFRHFTAWEKSE
jgi:hypothetical protein